MTTIRCTNGLTRTTRRCRQVAVLLLGALLLPASAANAGQLYTADTDSIPLLIITNNDMKPAFEEYAVWKAKRGSNTEIVTVTEIDSLYSDSTQIARIRSCIRDRYNLKHTRYALLGGDIDVIPALYLNPFGDMYLTDQFYSALDNDWNEDGDANVGEPVAYGDYPDYDPEVAVGRIPCRTLEQAAGVLNKLRGYAEDRGETGYYTSALITATDIGWPGDGAEMNADFAAAMPSHFTVQQIAQTWDEESVWAAYNAGHNIMINNAHAQTEKNFLTFAILNNAAPVMTWPRVLYYWDMDTLSNVDRCGIFFDWACWNNRLDSTYALGRYFMLNPNGGGVGFLSSTDLVASLYMRQYHLGIFSEIFDSGTVCIGDVMNNVKRDWTPANDLESWRKWAAIFQYLYLGDPQMEVWTQEPAELALSAPLQVDTSQSTLTVTVLSEGEPVAGAVTCIRMDTTIFAVTYTDSAGTATFAGLDFTSEGTATVVARRHNYFAAERSIEVYFPCCLGSVGNVDCSPDDLVTMSDLTVLQDILFISYDPPCCAAEANIDMSADGWITVGDLTILIDHLFINYNPLPACP